MAQLSYLPNFLEGANKLVKGQMTVHSHAMRRAGEISFTILVSDLIETEASQGGKAFYISGLEPFHIPIVMGKLTCFNL